MKKLAAIAFSLLLPALVLSQQKQRVLIIEGETILNEVLAFETQYLSESFLEGSVFYVDGTQSTGKLNYNLLVDEIHFIDQNNEIKALANQKDITHITLGNRVFRYTPKIGYAEEIVSNKAKLLLKRKVNVITETRYTGAYGTTTHSTNVRPVDNFNLFRGTSHRFDTEGIETARIKYSEGFFLEFKGKIHPFNKVNDAEKAVGKRNSKKLNEFLRSEGINFQDLKNLENVVSWISNNL
jgi:hypothetical protein